MNSADAGGDKAFTGGIPELYERHLVPLIFNAYADDLAQRLRGLQPPLALPARVLELAAGTGVVTRALASALPASVAIFATDLNQAMLDQAALAGTARPVQWQQADAQQLPFNDASFDAVVCQFGVMFFPDRARAFAEARRVLRPGGLLLFNVWDALEHNEFPALIARELAALYPQNPPGFLARTPYGYHDADTIRRDLRAGGFEKTPEVITVKARSRAAGAADVALAFCQGTPLRAEIEARDVAGLGRATNHAAKAIVRKYGDGAVEAGIQALVVSVRA